MMGRLERYRAQQRFALHAFAVMPDHVHVFFSPVASLERVVGMLKGGFSFAVRKTWKGEVWQIGYYAHRLVDRRDYDAQERYIVANPARKGLASYPHVHSCHGALLDPPPEHLDAGSGGDLDGYLGG